VGKSSLVNAITGETKAMVRDMPGTTRDAVDTPFTYKDQKFVLIDTAGIRRSGKIGTGNIEDWSVVRSQRAIERADIVALVIDAFDGISAQDLHILERALEENKGIILVANKWDKVLAKPGIDKITIMDRYIDYLREKVDFASFVIPVFTSATDGKRVEEILERAQFIFAERHKRIKTSVFNTFLAQILLDHPPTGNKKSHNPKIQYGSQVDTNPPKFVFFVNNPGHFHFSYARYIENRIRETFGFDGTPMVIEYKGKENPYYTKKSPQNKTFEGNKRKR
jgi:GTPase